MNGLTPSFYQHISTQHGDETTQTLKNISRSKLKLANAANRRNFLLRCKATNIIPKCCNINIRHLAATQHRDYIKTHRNFCFKLLNFEINETIKLIIKLEDNIRYLTQKLHDKIDQHTLDKFCNIQDIKFHNNFNKIKDNNMRKFQKLIEANDGYKLLNNIKANLQKWLINKSSTTIPEHVACILALGPEFHHLDHNNKQNTKNNLFNTLAAIESSLDRVNNVETDTIRHKITNTLIHHLTTKTNKHKHCSEIILTNAINETRKFVKKHPQLIITNADKGNITVLLDKQDYDSKCDELLKDTHTYKLLNSDPTNKFQLLTNKHITELKKDKLITTYEEHNLKIHNATSPKLYCCPKIHKPNCPLRPIVANIQTPNSSLSKYIANILSPLKHLSPYFIDSSFTLKEKLQGIYVPNEFNLISLDVISLFTCIPHNLMINAIETRWPDIVPHTEISKNKFIELIRHCLNTSYLQHHDQYYQQITGMPMGSSLSPILAEIVMFNLESSILKNHPEFNILFYYRYVDDILICLPEEQNNAILEMFNTYNSKIQFTMETQQKNTINYLDMSITINKNSLTTNWYRKPTWSGRYLHYATHYPKKYKLAVINNLVDRAIKLSNTQNHNQNKQIITETLIKNGYPKRLVVETIKNRTDSINNKAMNDSFNFPPNTCSKIYCSIPYYKTLHKRLYDLLDKIGITIAYTTANNNKQFFTKLKTKNDPKTQSNVVYKITCNTCGKNYIGETKQYIQKRIKQHEYNAKTNNPKHSAITEHTINTLHSPHYNKYKTLHTETNRTKRMFLEFVYIQTTPDTLNTKTDINDRARQYQPLFKLIKNL